MKTEYHLASLLPSLGGGKGGKGRRRLDFLCGEGGRKGGGEGEGVEREREWRGVVLLLLLLLLGVEKGGGVEGVTIRHGGVAFCLGK